MEPFEIMISESQERMAAVVEPGRLDDVLGVCARWDLDATVIGSVTGSGLLRAFAGGAEVGSMPVDTLVDGAPRYKVAQERPARLEDQPRRFAEPADPSAALRALLGSTDCGSRRWVTRQYDQLVGSGTVVRPGGDAVGRAADALGARDRRLPRRQRPADVARPAARRDEHRLRGGPQRRLHGRAAGGDDELPELRQPGDGRGRLRAGRVDRGHVAGVRGARPAGGVGQRLALQRALRPGDPPDAGGRRGGRAGRRVPGRARPGSARPATWCCWPATARRRSTARRYQKVVLGEHGGRIPEPDLDSERRLHEFLAQAAERGLLRSAHDVASGGIAMCVAEAAIAGAVGASVEADDLFGEGDGRVVITAARGRRRRAARARRRHAAARDRHGRRGGHPGRRRGAVAGRGGRAARRRHPATRWAPDVRHLRHLRPGRRPRPRRRTAHLLRPLRAAAPRPGERGHRRLRRQPGDGDEGHGPRQPGVRRAEAVGAARPDGDRPRALLDHRLDRVAQRPADRAARRRPDDRARPTTAT